MLTKNKKIDPNKLQEYTFTHSEIDLLSECIKRTTDYYKGWLMMRRDWGTTVTEAEIAAIEEKIRVLDRLQARTTYLGQSEFYKNL